LTLVASLRLLLLLLLSLFHRDSPGVASVVVVAVAAPPSLPEN